MAGKSEEEFNHDKLRKQFEILRLKLLVTEEEYDELRKHFRQLLNEGEILLRFAALVGLFLRHLEFDPAAMNIAERYVEMLRELNEIGKLTELQKTENDLEDDVLEIVQQQLCERNGMSPLAFVTGVQFGIDMFGD